MNRKDWMEHVAEVATPLLARMAHGLAAAGVEAIKEMKILVVVETGKPGEKATACEITEGSCKCPQCLGAALQAIVKALGLEGEVELREAPAAAAAEVLH